MLRQVLSCVAFLACLGFGQAQAIYLGEAHGEASLRGPIEIGDDLVLKQFLEKSRAEPLRIVYLNSEGGQIREGVAMARMIRKAGLDTAVRARTEVCESACTMLFAAGIHRYNIGGDSIYEGTTGLTGLGYHPAWQRGNRVRWTERSTEGLDQMAALYREMGQPRAAELCRRAAINTLWRPSGRTSLELKIATSLAAPPASRALARSTAGVGAQGARGSADEPVGDR